ncbi:MAG: hypothetical protein WC483_06320 [Candidatus Paceibacterota bacterium]
MRPIWRRSSTPPRRCADGYWTRSPIRSLRTRRSPHSRRWRSSPDRPTSGGGVRTGGVCACAGTRPARRHQATFLPRGGSASSGSGYRGNGFPSSGRLPCSRRR